MHISEVGQRLYSRHWGPVACCERWRYQLPGPQTFDAGVCHIDSVRNKQHENEPVHEKTNNLGSNQV